MRPEPHSQTEEESAASLCELFRELSGYLETRLSHRLREDLGRSGKASGSCLQLSAYECDVDAALASCVPAVGEDWKIRATHDEVLHRLRGLAAAQKPNKTTLQDAVGTDALLSTAADYLRWRVQDQGLKARLRGVAHTIFRMPEFSLLERCACPVEKTGAVRGEVTEILEEAAAKLDVLTAESDEPQAAFFQSGCPAQDGLFDPDRKQSVEHRSPELK